MCAALLPGAYLDSDIFRRFHPPFFQNNVAGKLSDGVRIIRLILSGKVFCVFAFRAVYIENSPGTFWERNALKYVLHVCIARWVSFFTTLRKAVNKFRFYFQISSFASSDFQELFKSQEMEIKKRRK